RPMPSGPPAWHDRAWLRNGHERWVIRIATRNLGISGIWRGRQPAGNDQTQWIGTSTAEPHVDDEPPPSSGGREDRIERGVQRTPIRRVAAVPNVAPERRQSQISDGVAQHAERHLVVGERMEWSDEEVILDDRERPRTAGVADWIRIWGLAAEAQRCVRRGG